MPSVKCDEEQFCWHCHSWLKHTWHHHERSLWLHGNEAGTEDGGGICCGDATHAANLLQLFADCLQGALPEQDTPVCKGKAPWEDRARAKPSLPWKQQNVPNTWHFPNPKLSRTDSCAHEGSGPANEVLEEFLWIVLFQGSLLAFLCSIHFFPRPFSLFSNI